MLPDVSTPEAKGRQSEHYQNMHHQQQTSQKNEHGPLKSIIGKLINFVNKHNEQASQSGENASSDSPQYNFNNRNLLAQTVPDKSTYPKFLLSFPRNKLFSKDLLQKMASQHPGASSSAADMNDTNVPNARQLAVQNRQ